MRFQAWKQTRTVVAGAPETATCELLDVPNTAAIDALWVSYAAPHDPVAAFTANSQVALAVPFRQLIEAEVYRAQLDLPDDDTTTTTSVGGLQLTLVLAQDPTTVYTLPAEVFIRFPQAGDFPASNPSDLYIQGATPALPLSIQGQTYSLDLGL